VIEEEEVVSASERKLLDELEAQRIIHRELIKKTERLEEELGSI
jgi:hypothetical protein